MDTQNNDSNNDHVLTTERLVLREPETGDANELAVMRSDPEINRFLNRPKSTTPEEAVAFIQKLQKGIAAKESFYWVISQKDNQRIIGTICLWNINREAGTAEVGYELQTAFQGNGFMQEALACIIELSFTTLNFNKLIAFTDKDNYKSRKLLETSGFKIINMPPKPGEEDDVIYELANPAGNL